ncbi:MULTISPECIES: hypothetical protein [Streptomyces]|uniref:Uncharacterized protein n=1 Tax=Streptomyces solicathayae TaxID=3081768 RepID=A0ABZ0LWH2_9ACTN|nr:hypothetical protein [Streptomyces sp. HUAS YS2]WOX23808.1 hypothetical protein R2D22_21445 [Streptomyces sp. HUAS YS2]
MTEVLHLQSRAYPLHYSSPDLTQGSVLVPGHGELRPVAGRLGSLAYNHDATIEIDLTDMALAGISLPGIEIAGCHARILSGGSVLVVYALRHERDLRGLSLFELDALDARVNNALREADAPILSAMLTASVGSGLVRGLRLRPDRMLDGDESPTDRRSVRYNCHFVTQDPPWGTDPRVPELIMGPACRVLLPFTYAWDLDPRAPIGDLLTMTEPTDIAVAQQSLLAGALLAGREILVDLAGTHPDRADVHAFRHFLDGIWAGFYHLDSYRIESAQDHRATYLAAREVIGLDGTQERADKLLSYVSSSMVASAMQRTEELDNRLNRVASALAVFTVVAFALDAAVFLIGEDGPLWGRLAAVVGVIAAGSAGLYATIHPRARERRRRRSAQPGS